MTTEDEYREALESWRKDGQAMHRVLLDIWHYVERGDTAHMTYGNDHETVAESVRRRDAEIRRILASDWSPDRDTSHETKYAGWIDVQRTRALRNLLGVDE